jgi:hypothetical protein
MSFEMLGIAFGGIILLKEVRGQDRCLGGYFVKVDRIQKIH